MASPIPMTVSPARGRGAVATHDHESLLDLVAGVAEAAVANPTMDVKVAARISMRCFNEAKLAYDAARGLADPRKDPERTPTANAILMRFNAQTPRAVSWEKLVSIALQADRTMWLAAGLRAEAVVPVSAHQLLIALRLVAQRLGVDTLGRLQYRDARNRIVAEDDERHGDEGLLGDLLPTLHQIEGQRRWGASTKLAGLKDPDLSVRNTAVRNQGLALGTVLRSMPPEDAAAFYTALNGAWPSRQTLTDWAEDTGFVLRNQRPNPWGPVIAGARALLEHANLRAPREDGPRSLGRDTRVSYRYPVNGIPGAPPRADRPDPVLEAEHEECCILALRIWLAGLNASADTNRSDYLAWQVGSGWPAPKHFDRHGGLKQLRARARHDNTAERREHGQPVTKTTQERAMQLRERLRGGTVLPAPVAFEHAVAVMLAGPHAVGPAKGV